MSADRPGPPDDDVDLFVIAGDEAVRAPAGDLATARGYRDAPDKGPVADGRRITLLTRTDRYRVGEEVRVVHAYEVLEPGHELYLAGPKPVWGESVDGVLVTPADNPQLVYDGEVVDGPGVDVNWEITTYRFDEPGVHEVVWEIEGLRSNTRRLHVEG